MISDLKGETETGGASAEGAGENIWIQDERKDCGLEKAAQ
jgi:hypothetical protein